MFKPLFCIILLLVFSISVVPVMQIISFLHQEEMFDDIDDIGDEETSLIKLIKKSDDCINNIDIYTSFKFSHKIQHNLKDEQFPSRFFNDIITPPPDL